VITVREGQARRARQASNKKRCVAGLAAFAFDRRGSDVRDFDDARRRGRFDGGDQRGHHLIECNEPEPLRAPLVRGSRSSSQ